jgi:hypothetical protein
MGKGGPLVFLDNASSFLPWRARDSQMQRSPIERACRFRKETIAALRAAGPAAPPAARLSARLARSLSLDRGAPVLSPEVLAALDARVAWLLGHVDGCIDKQGEQAVLSL